MNEVVASFVHLHVMVPYIYCVADVSPIESMN